MTSVTFFNGGTVTAGDDVRFEITVQTDGAATDVTGDTLTASFYHKGRKVLADKGVTLLTPASGIVRIGLSAAETADFPAGEMTFDIKAETLKRHFAEGRFMVRRGLT